MAAPVAILDLVEQFKYHQKAYQSGQYKEAQVRHEFIDKLFQALGWDVNNEQGYAEAYKEVIHEDAIKVANVTKAPDYCFRVGGTRKFFVEAKKPSTHIKDDTSAAFQLRRYAWSSKLPLSILTDFEEFAVYDCRDKPESKDKAHKGRILYITYEDYPKRWDEIAAVFSKEAILKGSFDKYVEDNKAKRGTAEVDAAFLDEIEGWRLALAQNIALRNPTLRTRELNYAVQATINRIVFLRICEARGLEGYGILFSLLNGKNIYERLTEMFLRADDKYNSGLFHFRQEKNNIGLPDELTLKLTIDDKPLKEIIKHLYYPDSPYEFGVLPADILGQVYERFLGKVIRLTPKHQAVIDEKPEVKKAGGVFYTPTYIVDYIVKNTVGKLLEGKKPKDIQKLKIADIACGSGSFLIGAYQYLMDWHRENYIKEGVRKHNNELYQTDNGEWVLTSGEKKRILLNHIYGVDIDSQAVEVTKLSLLLKVLENESGEILTTQWEMFQERLLPNLGNNIKCGNSLIDSQFFMNQQMALFNLTEDEQYRINLFNWKEEFPEVFKQGGFDAIIGNPPYIRIQALKEWAPIEVEYYKKKFKAASKGNYDIYTVFVEQGLNLLNDQGTLGYILPHKFFNAQYGEPLRQIISNGQRLRHIVHFGDEQVFSGATTYTCLLFLDKSENDSVQFTRADNLLDWRTVGKAVEGVIPAANVTAAEWNFSVGEGADLFEKLSKMPVKLGDVAHIFVGLQTSADKVFVVEQVAPPKDGLVRVKDSRGNEWELEQGILKPFLSHVTVSTYEEPKAKHWLVFPYRLGDGTAILLPANTLVSEIPRTWAYLLANSKYLRDRESGRFNNEGWYAFGRNQNLTEMEKPKLITQVISMVGRYAYDTQGLYMTGGGNGPYYGLRWKDSGNTHSLHYLQAILSSRLLDFYLHKVSTTFRGGYFSYGKRFIDQLPIRTIDFSNKEDKAKHDRMVALVEQMLTLHKNLREARTAQEKTHLQRQIDAQDKVINQLVYELYGLTDEEVKIVEGTA